MKDQHLRHLAIALLAVGIVTGDDGNHRGPRSEPETERDGLALLEHTTREIDRIAAEFHAKLSRERADSIGVIYCRYSTRHQGRIADQVRSILEEAVRLGIFVPREHIFFDLAVRGYKSRRAGLDQLRQVLERKAVSVAMFFAANRLFRKIHRTLAFVEESIVEQGIRAIFIKSGVDTADTDRRRMLLTFHSMTDEFVVSMYADNIRAAHEGLLETSPITTNFRVHLVSPRKSETTKPRKRCSSSTLFDSFELSYFRGWTVHHNTHQDGFDTQNPLLDGPPKVSLRRPAVTRNCLTPHPMALHWYSYLADVSRREWGHHPGLASLFHIARVRLTSGGRPCTAV